MGPYVGDLNGEMGDNLPVVELGFGVLVTSVATGWHHTCALLDSGLVKCWGLAQRGWLGDGGAHADSRVVGLEAREMGDNLAAVDLGADAVAIALSAGPYHACVVLDTGSVKCWGHGFSGKLGYGHTDDIGNGASRWATTFLRSSSAPT